MFGKLLGAMVGVGLGLAFQSGVAAVVLAVLGLFVGHRVDALHAAPELDDPPAGDPAPAPAARIRAPAGPLEEDGAELSAALCRAFVELARVDGEVSREEVRAARAYFERVLGYGPRALQRVRNQLKAAISDGGDLDAAAASCRDRLPPEGRLALLEALYDVALADGEVRRSERDALRRAAAVLEVPEQAQRAIAARLFGDGTEHYQTLGVSPAVTDEELRSAFRRLAAAHHPDRAAHLGAAEVTRATERFRRIQDAYDALRLLRNL